MKVLIVDDDKMNILILEESLQDAGYETVAAEDGLEALEALKKEKIKVILLDWMMPNMNGIEFMERISSNNKDFAKIPVIMQTAKATRDDVLVAINQGIYYYLVKPFTDDALLKVVEKAMQQASK